MIIKILLRAAGIFIASMLISNWASAGTFWRYGAGVFHTADYGFGESKLFSVGHEANIIGPFVSQLEGGLWTDSSGDGRKSSGFANASIGVQCTPSIFVIRSIWGVGFITTPDTMLGGSFPQFNHDLLFGFIDEHGIIIGFDLKHNSSAGIFDPNAGRDFGLIHVEVPF